MIHQVHAGPVRPHVNLRSMKAREPLGELFEELWERLSALLNRVTVIVADRATRDEHEEPLGDGLDWNSPAADQLLQAIDLGIHGWNRTLQRHPNFLAELSDEEDVSSFAPPEEEEYELSLALRAARESVGSRDRDGLRAACDQLRSLCEVMRIHHVNLFDEIDRTLTLLDLRSPTLLYLPSRPKLYIPQLLVESNESLIRELARHPARLFDISPRKFEEIVAELFWKAGYEVELTRQTRDGGRDIIALSKRMEVPLKLIIECKRYAPTNKVTLALVQRLFGVKVAEAANKAILATTSTFTRDARVFANSHLWDLDLKDHDAVVAWLRRHVGIATA
ncbi:MAG TPA: restriction endonuclease [Thermoanaerobaculia bacterium]|nr:restriction endonuclease [Thermoanaerobaculia bacterium]